MRRLIAALAIALIGTVSFASPDPVADTRHIMAGTVTTKSVKSSYLSGAKDATAAFQGALSAYKAIRAAEPALTVTCADGTVVKAPGACPSPLPIPPVVTPSDNPLVGQSPGVGAPDIATTDHNVLDDLQPAWGTGAIPSSSAPDVLGAFRFVCRHTNLAADDPTVFPGQPGASHLHDQTGVTGWNASSNYRNLRTGGGGSGCNDVAGADHDPSKAMHAANRTPYWQPALLDGKGNVILADYTAFYYKRRPASDPVVSDPSNPQYQGKAVPLPNGIKFLFGAFPDQSSIAPDAKFDYACVNASNQPDQDNLSFAQAVQCTKDNAQFGAQMDVHGSAPDCWDGVNLDTPDHRAHVAYGSYGSWGYYKCDAAHPYVIPTFTYAALYTIVQSDNGDIHFSSDEMDNSKPRGWSFHVDYGPAAWDPVVKAMWTDGCINSFLNCSGGDLGNGKQLKGASQPIYLVNGVWSTLWRNPVRLVPIPPKPPK